MIFSLLTFLSCPHLESHPSAPRDVPSLFTARRSTRDTFSTQELGPDPHGRGKIKKAEVKFRARLISTCSPAVTASFSLPFSPRNAPSAQRPVPLQPWEAPATPELADTGLSPLTPGTFALCKVWIGAEFHLHDIQPGRGGSGHVPPAQPTLSSSTSTHGGCCWQGTSLGTAPGQRACASSSPPR